MRMFIDVPVIWDLVVSRLKAIKRCTRGVRAVRWQCGIRHDRVVEFRQKVVPCRITFRERLRHTPQAGDISLRVREAIREVSVTSSIQAMEPVRSIV